MALNIRVEYMSNEVTFFERQKLEYLLRTTMSIREISSIVRRNHTIVSREIRRNGDSRKKYRADIAQRKFEKRKHGKHKGKLDKHPQLKKYVVDRLKEDWSPEEIAGRLKGVSSDSTGGQLISHESIYHYIYERDGRYENLYQHLRQAQKKRRRHYGRKHCKLAIVERISIHERPAYIGERTRYGDWESDSVIFSKQREVISVQSERKSRLVRIHKVENKGAEKTTNAILKTAESVPKDWFLTMTFDNGTENVRHIEIKKKYGINTYFCDPFASWQKGGVENANKLIRQYLPRKTDLSQLTDRDIYDIQEKLNNRPRKCLNYLTPNEVFNQVVL